MDGYVQDGEIRELAARLAELRNCSVDEAVRDALSETLERERQIAEKRARARPVLEEIWAMPRLRENFSDKDLYDENGLPIL